MADAREVCGRPMTSLLGPRECHGSWRWIRTHTSSEPARHGVWRVMCIAQTLPTYHPSIVSKTGYRMRKLNAVRANSILTDLFKR
jgi:hypothetical protein